MGRKIKLALLEMKKGCGASAFFVILFSILLVIINMLIGAVNNQEMTYTPYEKYLSSGGYLWNPYETGYFFDDADYFEQYDPALQRDTNINAKKFIDENLLGSMDVLITASTHANLSGGIGADIFALDDAVFDALQLPLSSGRQASGRNDVLVAANSCNVGAGDKLRLTAQDAQCDVTACGILTELTYLPRTNYNYLTKGTEHFFISSDSKKEASDNTVYIIARKSVLRDSGFIFQGSKTAMFYYTEKPSAEIYEANRKYLEEKGTVTELSLIDSQASEMLQHSYKKFIPLAILLFLISLVGLVFNVSLRTIKNMRRYAVYLLCGSSRRDVAQINLFSVLLMMGSSLLISAAALYLLRLSHMTSVLGVFIKPNNLLITLAMAAFCCLMAYIVPGAIIFRNSPAELIRSEQK